MEIINGRQFFAFFSFGFFFLFVASTKKKRNEVVKNYSEVYIPIQSIGIREKWYAFPFLKSQLVKFYRHINPTIPYQIVLYR